MSRLYAGRRPCKGENLAQVGDFEVWHFAHRSHYPWANLKLCAVPGVRRRKANYWISWNVEGKRVAASKDAQLLYEIDRGVYEQLHQVCQRMIDPDTLPQRKRPQPAPTQLELQALRVDLCNCIARLDMLMRECA